MARHGSRAGPCYRVRCEGTFRADSALALAISADLRGFHPNSRAFPPTLTRRRGRIEQEALAGFASLFHPNLAGLVRAGTTRASTPAQRCFPPTTPFDFTRTHTHTHTPVGGVAVTDVGATTLAVRSYYSAARRATPFGCNGSHRIRWPDPYPLGEPQLVRAGRLG